MFAGETRGPSFAAVQKTLGSAQFAHVLTLLSIGTVFAAFLVRSLTGWPGYIAILGGLAVLCGFSLVARWKAVEWYGILPISLLVFVGWAIASLLWSDYPGSTAVRLVYFLVVGFLGLYIALMRDTIQVVRATGDVLRVLLSASLLLEVFSGILIDAPIPFLNIAGDIAFLGPIQGIFGTRNMLGFVALIAAVTFVIEQRTKSVQKRRATFSISLAVLCLLLSGSPTAFIAAGVVLVASAGMYALRRIDAAARWRLHVGLAAGAVVAAVIAWILRLQILEALDARSEFAVRLDVWREMSRYLSANPLQGWGWVGPWPDTAPYSWIALGAGRDHTSGLSAYVDVYFQLGIIGLAAFVAFIGLAFARSWLLAARRRSVVYVWPALILLILVVTSFAESFALSEAGWLLLVVCAVKAARDMSWRDAALSRQ